MTDITVTDFALVAFTFVLTEVLMVINKFIFIIDTNESVSGCELLIKLFLG